MNIFLSKKTRGRILKAASVLTGVATVLSLSGLLYFAPDYAEAVMPSDYGLKEGNTISAAGSSDPDVYIVNDWGYKRLFLNPEIFNLYGHLGGFASVKNVSAATRDAFTTSGLFRVDGDEKAGHKMPKIRAGAGRADQRKIYHRGFRYARQKHDDRDDRLDNGKSGAGPDGDCGEFFVGCSPPPFQGGVGGGSYPLSISPLERGRGKRAQN